MAETDKTSQGLMEKFRIERLVPSTRGIDHTDCRYFVLDPQHDAGAWFALRAYMVWADKNGYVPLASDLQAWLDSTAAAWTPRTGTIEDDLRSRLACVVEATHWDRPYDERIDAIRGMCDLTTNGMTPQPAAADQENPYLPKAPAGGKHIFNGGYRCTRCGVYNHPAESNVEALNGPCQGRWAHSGKMRSAAEDRWKAERTAAGREGS